MAKSLVIPQSLTESAAAYWGDEGRRWLAGLPRIVTGLQERCSTTTVEPVEGCRTTFVARADGAILKVLFEERESRHEPDALRTWEGNGAIRLLRSHDGAMLVERCEPGTTLRGHPDADEIAADILRRLWIPIQPATPFELVGDMWGDWADKCERRYDEFGRPFERRLLDQAVFAMRELPGSAGAQVLLHGDFHHDNVLRAQREPWLAIDPKPLAGDPAFDTAQYVWNCGLGGMHRCLDRLSSLLELDRERMRLWTLAKTVEGSLWNRATGRPAEGSLACARALG